MSSGLSSELSFSLASVCVPTTTCVPPTTSGTDGWEFCFARCYYIHGSRSLPRRRYLLVPVVVCVLHGKLIPCIVIVNDAFADAAHVQHSSLSIRSSVSPSCLDVSTITDSNVINIPVPTGTWSTPRCEYASVCCAKPPNLAFRNRVQYTVVMTIRRSIARVLSWLLAAQTPIAPPLHLEPTDSTPLLVADLLVPDAVVMPVRGPPAPRSYAGHRHAPMVS
ncbi:hypothetical protein RhiXN_11145 [Rhizoctonia solani]|uniref:Uncharacterized protein n=1 Tax=Rhizoctonia solani TaxID=456999 RepID=A0A8H8T2Y8_9AGAM|nr:uncharacterized protein RhiXN_11145 [Rhizoctonia solani]QRW26068.1 hypothetical protein RhiXN_11145 [Rhizoctonia solani]